MGVTGRSFAELLGENVELRSHLTTGQVTELLDPARYSGLCRQFAEEGAVRARATVTTLAAAGFPPVA